MASIVANIRTMSGVGVLADRTARSPSLQFRRYNLIYGFNGSGKSTLSRLFASLQAGVRNDRLPPICKFEFELDDGAMHTCPDSLVGLERRILVFNADFIEQNLQWSIGHANPVFYIGREQAELAAELSRLEASVPAAEQRRTSAAVLLRARERALSTFKRERARLIADRLRLRNRKYEAPQLAQDFAALDLGEGASLEDQELEAFTTTCRLDEAMARVAELAPQDWAIVEAMKQARALAGQTPGAIVIHELEQHPDMLLWVKEASEYHSARHLEACLFCGNPITATRRELLERALDDRLNRFLGVVEKSHGDAGTTFAALETLRTNIPTAESVSGELRSDYKDACIKLTEEIKRAHEVVGDAIAVLAEKKRKPTQAVDTSGLKSDADVDGFVASLVAALGELNDILRAHNERVEGFKRYQEEARLAVRRHFLATGQAEYTELERDQQAAVEEAAAADEAGAELTREIARLRSDIREHGHAAAKINKLIESYLGHGELTISAVTDGYEIHRYGRLVEGAPSEGEKTAIALCYFISTLESDGRSLQDLIVVIDDPISSLDTKALNFACALVKNRLSEVAQLFVLTHNQHCMNEFKKAWKSRARPSDPAKSPTATFLFMDVSIPKGQSARSSTMIEMSKLLREYDFEYHFLFHHVLKFEASRDPEYEYSYMMPNVLRRVLDVFLAFRCPGSAGFVSKIEQLCADHPTLDRDRITALDRLAQVESHSDSLDDLIAFSSMAVEETRDANAALLLMMETVDPEHVNGLRRLCR